MTITRYDEPNLAARATNVVFRWLAEAGVSIAGTRALRVRGRTTGKLRGVVVNLMTVDGRDYVVSPRGNTQWVRNMRVAGGGELRIGRRVEKFTATELPVEERPAVLRAYLKKWKFEVGMFFQGVGPDAPEDKILAIAPDHPVFRIRS